MGLLRATSRLPRARPRISYASSFGLYHPPVAIQLLMRGCRNFAGISASRLEEFVRAEEHYFAQQRQTRAMEPLTFAQLVSASIDFSPGENLHGTSQSLEAMLRRELPIRFAARISHIKSIPGWERIPELCELQEMHVKSFRELRLAELGDNASVAEVVRNIRQRHKKIIPLFAEAVSKMRDSSCSTVGQQTSASQAALDQRMEVDRLDDWAEKFVGSRISTEVLMTHYLVSRKESTGPVDPTKIGILDTECDPYDVCLQVADKLERGPLAGCVIRVREPSKKIQLCQTPRYLFYLVEELLWNACKATFKKCLGDQAAFESNPIIITVCADNQNVVIRMCDTGGGMPTDAADHMWSFSHSSHRQYLSSLSGEPSLDTNANQCSLTSVTEPDLVPETPEAEGHLKRRPWGIGSGFSPISGRGVSLPNCLFYARYLGGSLNIMNLPGEGVDAYLGLRRIETS